MKPTTKTLIATLLLFFITTGIMAQEKYEYAIIYLTARGEIEVANHSTTEKTPILKGDAWEVAVIKKVEELNKAGWEVYNTTAINGNSVYYLHRKIKE